MLEFRRILPDSLYSGDYITNQRTRVLLVTDVVIIFLVFGVLIVSQTFRTMPFSQYVITAILVVSLAAMFSLIFLYRGNYRYAAHVLVIVALTGIWYLNIAYARSIYIKSEMAFVLAILALPSLLIGRVWTWIYSGISILLTWYIAYVLYTVQPAEVNKSLGFAVDYTAAILFIAFFSSIISSIYERALSREKRLLEEQEKSSLALGEYAVLLEQAEAQKRQFYRETIYSVTSGKLSIVDEPDIRLYTVNAEIEKRIDDAASASSARVEVREYCEKQGLKGEPLEAFILGVGEALTNAIKHGIRGMVSAGRADNTVWVAVSDEGKGIESLSLPRMILLKGYSTKPSLGMGYSIMLDMSDRVLLKTDEKGTTVVLIKNLDTPFAEISLDKLTGSW